MFVLVMRELREARAARTDQSKVNEALLAALKPGASPFAPSTQNKNKKKGPRAASPGSPIDDTTDEVRAAIPLDGTQVRFGPCGFRATVFTAIKPTVFKFMGVNGLNRPHTTVRRACPSARAHPSHSPAARRHNSPVLTPPRVWQLAPIAMRACNLPTNDMEKRGAFDRFFKADLSAVQAKVKQGYFDCFVDTLLTIEGIPAIAEAGSANQPNMPVHEAKLPALIEPPAGAHKYSSPWHFKNGFNFETAKCVAPTNPPTETSTRPRGRDRGQLTNQPPPLASPPNRRRGA